MTIFGIREPQSTILEIKDRWPEVKTVRVFVGGVRRAGDLVTPVRNACQPVWDAGLTPVVSFKPNVSDVYAGRFDAPLDDLAQYLGTKPSVHVIPWHEPEDDMNGPTFQGMFNRVKSHLPDISVGYACNSYRWRYGSETSDPRNWVVDADFYSADVYSGNSWPTSYILPEHPGFRRWFDELIPLTPTGTYWLTERGFQGTSTGIADAINRESDWLKNTADGQRCVGYMYWNSPGAENDPAWVLDTRGEEALWNMMATPQPPPDDRYDIGYEDGYNAGYDAAITDALGAVSALQND